jgi:uncharacterized membrane protein YdjX (TVP38/TMEM64 family)
MLRTSLETRLMRTLTRRAQHPAFPVFTGGVALAAALSMAVPFASLLILAVLMAPKRWKAIAMWSSLGAALGCSLLYLAFHHLGWARLLEIYPDVMRSAAWMDSIRWLNAYGVLALLVIAVLPLPLTPALMFAAVSPLPVAEVLLALWLGKLVKYTAYAWFSSAFPGFAINHGRSRIAALHGALSRATETETGADMIGSAIASVEQNQVHVQRQTVVVLRS